VSDNTDKTMRDLHSSLAKLLKESVEQEYTDADGKPVPPPAAILNVARQFLKDNNIDALPAKGSPLDLLQDAMPFGNDDNLRQTLN
jgi:hypothetical protein